MKKKTTYITPLTEIIQPWHTATLLAGSYENNTTPSHSDAKRLEVEEDDNPFSPTPRPEFDLWDDSDNAFEDKGNDFW